MGYEVLNGVMSGGTKGGNNTLFNPMCACHFDLLCGCLPEVKHCGPDPKPNSSCSPQRPNMGCAKDCGCTLSNQPGTLGLKNIR